MSPERIRRHIVLAISVMAAILFAPLSTQAGLTRTELRSVGVSPPRSATLPPWLSFRDTNGGAVRLASALDNRPGVLLFSDFACKSLCGPALTMTAAALAQSGLEPGRDFHLLIISLRPSASNAQARDFVRPQLSPALLRATRILIGTPATLGTATRALGYHYLFDPAHDQFAHPAAAFVLGRSAGLSAVLSAPGMRSIDMRLALLAAGTGGMETLADRLRLLCYCYDPVTGIYSVAIGRLVDAAAAITLLALAGAVFLLRRKERRA